MLGAFALASVGILLVALVAGNWITLTGALVWVEVFVGGALLVLLAFASANGIIIPGIVFRAIVFLQALAFASLFVVIRKRGGAFIAVSLILDYCKDGCSWCVFACVINSYLDVIVTTF